MRLVSRSLGVTGRVAHYAEGSWLFSRLGKGRLVVGTQLGESSRSRVPVAWLRLARRPPADAGGQALVLPTGPMKPFAREQAGYAFQRVDSVPESAPASIKLNDARSSSPLSLEYGEDDSDAFTATRPTAPSLRQLALVGALLTLAFFLGRVTHGRPPRPPAQILSAAGLCLNLALPPPNVDDGVPIAFPSRSE